MGREEKRSLRMRNSQKCANHVPRSRRAFALLFLKRLLHDRTSGLLGVHADEGSQGISRPHDGGVHSPRYRTRTSPAADTQPSYSDRRWGRCGPKRGPVM